MTDDEAKRAIAEFNSRIEPVEKAFMVYVEAYKSLGYGRMIQMIREKWDAELSRSRKAVHSEGDGKIGVRDLP